MLNFAASARSFALRVGLDEVFLQQLLALLNILLGHWQAALLRNVEPADTQSQSLSRPAVMAAYLLRSDGRTPSHLMSGVVKLLLSYDMFLEPLMYTERICVQASCRRVKIAALQRRPGGQSSAP